MSQRGGGETLVRGASQAQYVPAATWCMAGGALWAIGFDTARERNHPEARPWSCRKS